MKPIAILRFAAADGPAYFAEFISLAGKSFTEIRVDHGAHIPSDSRQFGGIALMGGPMSVNDPLPWIPSVLALIQDATSNNVPLIGHCLGGQLISKALGGSVGRSPKGKEIGWHAIQIQDTSLANEWFGRREGFDVFQWHGEAFTLPAGSTRIASSDYCENQAFILGPHIGMQFHIEIDETTIENWCDGGSKEINAALKNDPPHEAVMTSENIKKRTPHALPRMRLVADHLYHRWLLSAT